ncbi:MAG: hypothetical protein WB421_16720 [Terriglobales bacterium]|jgi:hypothetical protein
MNEDNELDLLPPVSLTRPLWGRLLIDFRDAFAPEKLPPLQLTSRPIDVGMLQGDRLSLPWYKTVFTNLGDVISPENLPPLILESQPMDVGELISDQMGHPWWSSLLRSLADAVAPERQPALQLTSAPMNLANIAESNFLQVPQWSSAISTPKVFLPDKPKTGYAAVQLAPPRPIPKVDPAEIEFVNALEQDLRRDLRRSRIRARIWTSIAIAQVMVLAAGIFASTIRHLLVLTGK